MIVKSCWFNFFFSIQVWHFNFIVTFKVVFHKGFVNFQLIDSFDEYWIVKKLHAVLFIKGIFKYVLFLPLIWFFGMHLWPANIVHLSHLHQPFFSPSRSAFIDEHSMFSLFLKMSKLKWRSKIIDWSEKTIKFSLFLKMSILTSCLKNYNRLIKKKKHTHRYYVEDVKVDCTYASR